MRAAEGAHNDTMVVPERLFAAFTRDLPLLMIQWSEFAGPEIKRWPRTDGLGMTQRTRDLLQRLADEQPIIGT